MISAWPYDQRVAFESHQHGAWSALRPPAGRVQQQVVNMTAEAGARQRAQAVGKGALTAGGGGRRALLQCCSLLSAVLAPQPGTAAAAHRLQPPLAPLETCVLTKRARAAAAAALRGSRRQQHPEQPLPATAYPCDVVSPNLQFRRFVHPAWYFFYFGAGVCLLPYVNLVVYKAAGCSEQQIGILGALKVCAQQQSLRSVSPAALLAAPAQRNTALRAVLALECSVSFVCG